MHLVVRIVKFNCTLKILCISSVDFTTALYSSLVHSYFLLAITIVHFSHIL